MEVKDLQKEYDLEENKRLNIISSIEGAIQVNITENDIVLTDNYNPVDMLIS